MGNRLKPFETPPGMETYEPAKTFPDRLTFLRPSNGVWFRAGLNLIVVRGEEWLGKRGAVDATDVAGNLIGQYVVEETLAVRFLDVRHEHLLFHHDCYCDDLPGLYERMREYYPDFGASEVVTLVFFQVQPGKSTEGVFS